MNPNEHVPRINALEIEAATLSRKIKELEGRSTGGGEPIVGLILAMLLSWWLWGDLDKRIRTFISLPARVQALEDKGK